MIKQEFGIILRRMRVQSGLTLQKLSEKADISMRFLQEMEAGKKGPSMETLFKLSRAFEAQPGELLESVWKDWLKGRK